MTARNTRKTTPAKAEETPAAEPETQPEVEPDVEPETQPEVEPETEPETEPEPGAAALAAYVHVALENGSFHVFPAGTKVGEVVNGVELSEELAETITNPKAWAGTAQAD